MMERRITSRKNPALQQVRRLFTSRTERQKTGLFVADGTKLLQEAVRWGAELVRVILADGVEAPGLPESAEVLRVPQEVMESISNMQAPQGAIFVCRIPKPEAPTLQGGTLILDGIQDPGNLGTILRTADALEVPVLLSEGCADPYNAKTLRAAMGAIFRTPPRFARREQVVELCRQKGVELAVTRLSPDAADIRKAPLKRCAMVIGSEGQGVCSQFIEAAQRQLIIPMNPRCESLNAAIAATIVMWQLKNVE